MKKVKNQKRRYFQYKIICKISVWYTYFQEETTSINGKDSGHGTAKSEEIGFPNGDARYSPVSDTASLHCYENTAMSEASETPFTREQSDEKLEADGKLEPENSRLSLNISMKSLPNDFEMNSCQSINSHTILMDKMEDDDDGYDFDAVKDCQSDEESQSKLISEMYIVVSQLIRTNTTETCVFLFKS